MTYSHPSPVGQVRVLTPAGLVDGRDRQVLEATGQLTEPLIGVDLDDLAHPGVVSEAAQVATTSTAVLVGVATRDTVPEALRPLVNALDLTVVPCSTGAGMQEVVPVADPRGHLAELHTLVSANPHAATMLAGLLRWSGSLPVPAALDAESLAYSTLLGGVEFRRWIDRRGPRPLPPAVAADPVLVDRDGPVLHVRLNRPERRNAYGRDVRDALVAALELAVLDPGIERVMLSGFGSSFSSGGDLDEFGTTPDLATAHFVRTRAGASRLLHRLADRVEVHIHGTCVGAGIELPAFASRVVAISGTTIRLPEIGMGLVPGAGGTVSIPRRIGRWRTLYLALAGTPLAADTALRWGLVDRIDRAASAHHPGACPRVSG